MCIRDRFDIMRKKEKYPRNVPHALIYYENGFSANAYMLAQKMTDEGKIVIISTADSEDKAFLEAEKRGIKRVIIQTDVCTGYDI